MQYIEMLHRSPWAAETYGSQLVEHAYYISSLLFDNVVVDKIASLVNRASQILVFGQDNSTNTKKPTSIMCRGRLVAPIPNANLAQHITKFHYPIQEQNR